MTQSFLQFLAEHNFSLDDMERLYQIVNKDLGELVNSETLAKSPTNITEVSQ